MGLRERPALHRSIPPVYRVVPFEVPLVVPPLGIRLCRRGVEFAEKPKTPAKAGTTNWNLTFSARRNN
jgi:hypothetical protein